MSNDTFLKTEVMDRLVDDGGLISIFRTIACVGDSLSSGEMEQLYSDGHRSYHDLYEYSWGQFIARSAGCKVYNFSRGGMSAKWYIDTYADENGFWDKDKACQAYVIALGVNDMFGSNQEIGSVEDIDFNDYTKNKQTIAGYYAQIIQRYKQISPDARFFLVTMPKAGDGEAKEAQKVEFAKVMYDFAKVFTHTHVVDLNAYAPEYDEDFKRKFYFNNHLNPAGYYLTSRFISSLITRVILEDPEDFYQVALIDKKGYNHEIEKDK